MTAPAATAAASKINFGMIVPKCDARAHYPSGNISERLFRNTTSRREFISTGVVISERSFRNLAGRS
jgi:hypothetical protein